MANHPLHGHHLIRQQLAGALSRGTLPQVIALVGPQGVGKQRIGLWLGQLILCEQGRDEPCGKCHSCLQVLNLAHPDLHWLAPVPRPKAADGEKQVEELADLQAELVAARREKPFYGSPEGLEGHFVSTARLIQRRAALTPAAGRWKLFLIGYAERLVPQESSAEAANALLKLFEEPPADTIIVLTTEDLNGLLPTIRSRAVPLRVGRLTDPEVAEFLNTRMDPALTPAEIKIRVGRASGAIGTAILDPAESDTAREAAHRILEAVIGGPGSRAERVFRQPGFAARGEFTNTLDALAETLADATREAAGRKARLPLPRALIGKAGVAALARASAQVSAARQAAQGNVNPQLLLAVLVEDLAEALCV